MKTWNKETKQFWIDTMQAHQDADRIIQGSWWMTIEKKGCFFGCVVQDGCYSSEEIDILKQAAELMHLPYWLVALAERLFEIISNTDEMRNFPVAFCKAVPCDVDIEYIRDHLYDLLIRDRVEDFLTTIRSAGQ